MVLEQGWRAQIFLIKKMPLNRAEWKKKIHVVNSKSFRIDFIVVVIVVYAYLCP